MTDAIESTNDTPEISDEQAADFAALQRSVNESEAQATATGQVTTGEVMQEPPVDLGREIAGLVLAVKTVIAPMFPSVAEVYTAEVTEALGQALGGVCNKYGWLQGGVMGKWTQEIMLLVVAAPIAMATVDAAKQDIAVHKAKNKPALGYANTTAPPALGEIDVGTKTVTVGAQVAADTATSSGLTFGNVR